MNGAQTVEARARSGGTSRYSDGTDAPRAPIEPNASFAAVVALPRFSPPIASARFLQSLFTALAGRLGWARVTTELGLELLHAPCVSIPARKTWPPPFSLQRTRASKKVAFPHPLFRSRCAHGPRTEARLGARDDEDEPSPLALCPRVPARRGGPPRFSLHSTRASNELVSPHPFRWLRCARISLSLRSRPSHGGEAGRARRRR